MSCRAQHSSVYECHKWFLFQPPITQSQQEQVSHNNTMAAAWQKIVLRHWRCRHSWEMIRNLHSYLYYMLKRKTGAESSAE